MSTHYEEAYIRRAMARGIQTVMMLNADTTSWNPTGPDFVGEVNVRYSATDDGQIAATSAPRLTFHEAWGEAKDRDDYRKSDWNRAQSVGEKKYPKTIVDWLEFVTP